MSERLSNQPLEVRRKNEIERTLLTSERSPSVQAAHDRAILNETVLDAVGVEDMLQDFNDRVLQVDSPVYSFDECFYQFHEQDSNLPLQIAGTRMINGYSLFWENKDASRMKVVGNNFLPLQYRLSVSVLDASLYAFCVQSGYEFTDINNEVLEDLIRTNPELNPVVIGSTIPPEKRKYLPLITANNTFMPVEGEKSIDELRGWTERSMYRFYFKNFHNTQRLTRYSA